MRATLNLKTSIVFLSLVLSFFVEAHAQSEQSENVNQELETEFSSQDQQEQVAPKEAPYYDAEEIEVEKQKNQQTSDEQIEDSEAYDDEPLPSSVTKLAPFPVKQEKRVKRRYLYHPYTEKGLYKITEDGDYLYRVEKSPESATAILRLGIFDAPSLVNGATGASYSDLYGGNDPMLLFTYEWKLDHWMKNLSFNVGSGLIFASGEGRLQSGNNAGQASEEKFTFIMLPNHAGLSYKFKFFDQQKFIPYVEGGAGYYVFNEYRDDGEPPLGRFGGAAVLHAVGGLAVAVTSFDQDSSLRLDADYGINSVWLIAEVRQNVGFGTFNLTATLFNAGVMTHF